MRLLKTHFHTSERPGYEARRNAKKSNKETQTLQEGEPPVKTCRVPPVWRGGRGEKGATARQTTAKTLPRTVSVAGGGEMKKREVKENTGANTRETKVMTLPQATIVAGGARQETKTNMKWKGGTTHSPARGKGA